MNLADQIMCYLVICVIRFQLGSIEVLFLKSGGKTGLLSPNEVQVGSNEIPFFGDPVSLDTSRMTLSLFDTIPGMHRYIPTSRR